MKLRMWFWMALFVFMGSVAFAWDGTSPAGAVAAASDGSLWKGILNGCLAGAMAAVAGWLKNRNTSTGDQERFEIKYMIPTVIVGAIVGIVAALMKKTPANFEASIEASPIFAAITLGADYLLKIVWRNGILHLRDMLADFKSGTGNPPPAPPPAQ